MAEILVTSYKNPDLDGTACAVAYAELLQKQNKDAIAAIFGTLHRETEFVLEIGHIPAPRQGESLLSNDTKVILADASDTIGMAKNIDPRQVIEIIDHRKVNHAEDFPQAKVQIELVGSAATLIAEKFYYSKTSISKESALLLYGAIISNTINFKATVTTDRDKKMAEWLTTCCDIPKDFIHEMFISKSQFAEPLEAVFEHDFALIPINDLKIGIVQLEIVEVSAFLKKNKNIIESILQKIKNEKSLTQIFLTLVDVEKSTNDFFVIDPHTQQLLENVLHIHFENNIAHREGILMRKQIVPLIKEFLN